MKIMFTTSNILRLLMPRPHIELSTDIMSRFTRHTKIAEFTPVPDSFPVYVYTLASFDELRTRVGKKKAFCQRLIMLARGIMKAVRNINITNNRETASVAL